ncbi:glycosyltransferase family 2 protein [Peristeroidobacter soli]|uniref:glycosyltransferase family 2 protein n=1 Tax=Peristeroidobacter soli TaxID=2497877 RepID=UPI0013007736|nr:glycosyltransferase family 2 protein [Peristeroidobacter soli]
MKLSICITTFNRAQFIGTTLESILVQLTEECELVVLDGASTDDTERVVSDYSKRFDQLRYFRQKTNQGIDRDYDCVVQLARGEYCWLMSDDDILKPHAIATVLHALEVDLSLIIVNVEYRSLDMSKALSRRWVNISSDRAYPPSEMDRLFSELGDLLKYIGCIIIKRSIWLTRERQRYYGSSMTYFGVIFQDRLPLESRMIATPLISYRGGNTHAWSTEMIEIIFHRWPSLVESLPISESAKSHVASSQPWKHMQWLLLLRGAGFYSFSEYRKYVCPKLASRMRRTMSALIAILPGRLVNAAFILFYNLTPLHFREVWLLTMRQSRFYFLRRVP